MKNVAIPLSTPQMAIFPSGVKATAVMNSPADASNATDLSGMLQSLSCASREPARKKRSSVGWKAIDVTRSLCLKVQRHSFLLVCQSRTVLSMEEERRKLFLLQLK